MKYKIVKESKALPEGYKVGDLLEKFVPFHYYNVDIVDIEGEEPRVINISQSHLSALIELGVVEEVKEWNPRELKKGEYYWKLANPLDRTILSVEIPWVGDELDLIDRALGNCHPTREAAEAWRDKLLADYNK